MANDDDMERSVTERNICDYCGKDLTNEELERDIHCFACSDKYCSVNCAQYMAYSGVRIFGEGEISEIWLCFVCDD